MVLNDNEFESMLGGEAPSREPMMPSPQPTPASGVPMLDDEAFESALAGAPDPNRVGLSLKFGRDMAPEQAAKVLQLQQQTGMPIEFVERNAEDLAKQVAGLPVDPQKFTKEAPRVASWIAEHPTNAAVAQDDLELLRRIEEEDRRHSFWRQAWKSLGSGAAQTVAGIAKIPGQAVDLLALPGNAFYKAIGRPDLMWQDPSGDAAKALYAPQNQVFKAIGRDDLVIKEPRNTVAEYYQFGAEELAAEVPALNESIILSASKGDLGNASKAFAMQLISQVPNFAMLYAGGLGGLNKTTMTGAGLMQAAETAERGREAGLDPVDTQLAALTQGSAEALFERMGTLKIVEKWGKALAERTGKETALRIMAGTGKMIAANAGQEGLEEVATSGVQSASDYASGINPNMTFTEALLKGGDAFLLGAGMGAGPASVGAIPGVMYRTEAYRQAKSDREFYKAIVEGVATSKTMQRLPEARRELVERIVANGPAEFLYVEPEDIKRYFQERGVDADAGAAELGIQVEYREAIETGQDIKVKTSDWAAKVAGTEHSLALADDIKFDPEGITPRQAKQQDAEIQAAIEDADKNASADAKESADFVKTTVVDQLVAAGIPKDQAQANAEVWRRTFVYFSAKDTQGRTPRQLFEQYGIRIARPGDTDVVIPPSQSFMSQQPGSALIARHNLTEGNLLHALDMGGLPVPSIAIAPLETQFDNFGEITLVAPSSLIDPRQESSAKVFAADVYSPRYPSVEYQFKSKALETFRRELSAASAIMGGAQVDQDRLNREGPAALENDPVFMAHFLNLRGIVPNVAFNEPDADRMAEYNKHGFEKYFGKESWNILDMPGFKEEADAYWRDILKDEPTVLAEYNEEPYDWARRLARDIATQGQRATAREVSVFSSRDNLRAQIKELGLQGEFVAETKRVVKETLKGKERIFQGFTDDGDRRYAAHTLKKVVQIMSKNLRGGEGFNYGAGSVRALLAPQFRSLSQIQQAKDRLVSPETFAALKEEANNEMLAIMDMAARSLSGERDSFGAMRSAEGALSEAAEGKAPVGTVFAQYGMQLEPQQIARVEEFFDKLRSMPTEYFEALVTRAVDVGEFAAAVVPSTIGPIARKALEDRGVRLFEYDATVEGDRQRAVEAAANAIPEEVLFQRAMDRVAAQWARPSAEKFLSDIEADGYEQMTPNYVMGLAREMSAQDREALGLPEFLRGKTNVGKAQLMSFVRGRIEQMPKVLFQSDLSRIGFFSTVRRAVMGINFKSMPAKQLAAQIKNMQGIKKAELTAIGLIPYLEAYEGKITKEEVVQFVDDNKIIVDMKVLGKWAGGDVGDVADWGEITSRFERESASEAAYESAREHYRYDANKEIDKLRDELLTGDDKSDYIDEDGNIDERALERAIESRVEDMIKNYADAELKLYEENPDDYPWYHTIEIKEKNSRRTFSRDGDGFWRDDLTGKEFSDYDDEFKIQATNWMIDNGYLEGNKVLPTLDMLTFAREPIYNYDDAEVDAIAKSPDLRERFIAAKIKDGLTPEAAEQAAKDDVDAHPLEADGISPWRRDQAALVVLYSALPANTDFELSFYGWAKGKIVGPRGSEAAPGQEFAYKVEYELDGERTTKTTLTATSIQQARELFKQHLVEKGHARKPVDLTAIADPILRAGAELNAPETDASYSQYLVASNQYENREILLTYKPTGSRKFTTGHFSGASDVAHMRTVIVPQDDGTRTLIIDEIQSDWNQQGRGLGYTSTYQELLKEVEAEREALFAEMDKVIEVIESSRGAIADAFEELIPEAVANSLYNEPKLRDAIADVRDSRDPNEKSLGMLVNLFTALRDDDQIGTESSNYWLGVIARRDALKLRKEALNEAKFDIESRHVPDNPFTDTDAWASLVIRRALRMAVELGVDSISFAPGAVHSKRWGTEYIHWKKNDDGSFTVGVDGQYKGDAIDEVLQGRDLNEALAARGELPISESKTIRTYEEFEPMILQNFREIVHKQGTWQAIKVAKRYWKMMQEKDSGADLRRTSGFLAFYDDFVAKKLVPKLLKELDPQAKPEVKTLDNLKENYSDAQFTVIKVTDKMREAYGAGASLFQTGDGPRGQIRFLPDRKFAIDLFKNADASTFMHESAHLFLEIMRDLATQQNANQGIVEDYKVILNQFGVAGPEDITREHHEQFAEMFENYLATSDAPSPSLRRLFTKFRTWLTAVYKSIKQIGTPVSPEIKGVFDKIMTLDDEIVESEGVDLSSGDIIEKSMTKEQAEEYRTAKAEAEAQVREKMVRRTIQDAERARKRAMKQQREIIEAEITAEVDARRDIRAFALLSRGTKPDGSPLDDGVKAIKISKSSVAKYVGPETMKNLPKPYIYSRDGGLEADVVADLLGFDGPAQMFQELLMVPDRKKLIQERVDERMRQEVALLQEAPPPEVIEARHTSARERVLRMELEHLMAQNPKVMKKIIRRLAGRGGSMEAIREKARNILAKKSVGDVSPRAYLRAEQKARRDAAKALTAGDVEQAFRYKHAELVNFEMYRAALEFQQREAKFKQLLKRLRKKDEDLAKTRDMNMVGAARAIVAQFGLGSSDKSAYEYVKPIAQYDALSFASVEALIQSVAAVPVDIDDATVDQAVTMYDTVEAIWSLSRSMREMEIDGKVQEKSDIIKQLVAGLQANASKASINPNAASLTGAERFKIELMSFMSSLKRVEQWVDLMDGGDLNGPFRRYVWQPISEAVTQYRVKKKPVIERIHKALKQWAPNDDTAEIIAGELNNFVFRGKTDLLGMMLHLGNKSNKDKLVLGYGWGEKDADGNVDYTALDAFMNRMHREGKIGKADWDLVQELWDTMESLKGDAQLANREMFGFFFNELTAEKVMTPFGEYRGGYAPAVTDPDKVRDMADKKHLEEMTNAFDVRALPTAGRGFTKNRVEGYAAPLLLDLRLVVSNVDKVLKFTYIEPTARKVGRLVSDREFEQAMRAVDPTAVSELLLPWLKRAVQQRVSQPANTPLDKIAKIIRARTGLQTMFFNVANTLQQITGFSLTAVKVPPKYVAKGFARYASSPREMANLVAKKSPFMATRLDDQVSQMNNEIDAVLVNPSTFTSFRDFVTRHGYFMQQFSQNIVDVSSWLAAYDEASARGDAEIDAIRYADNVIRTTQGSMAPEDIAAFEAGSPARRLFTMFVGYFNMQANLLGAEFLKAYHANGLRPKYSRLFYVYIMGLAVPAFLSELIARGAAGELDWDDDDEDQFLTELVTMFFGSQARNVTGMVPYVGSAINTVFASQTDTPMDDRLQTSPAISAIESAALATGRMLDVIQDDGKSKRRAAKDSLTLFSLITGIPTGPVSRPAVYLIDVEEGRAQPESELDFARGLVTGRPGK